MGAPITPTDRWDNSDIDMIIDVRSPAEFADDHIEGAINLPVLSNEERAEIGTIYKQTSPFEARRKGAALVSQNIAHHLQSVLKDKPSNFKPLIHCWRGGQRSRSFATICSEIGWPSYILEGGYKAYRSAVVKALEITPSQFELRLISGPTGSAKTRLLTQIKVQGGQILDLEALAVHRGSLLGADPNNPQPSQRFFETKLYSALSKLSAAQPVYVEAESAKIGKLYIPKTLWQSMCDAPAVTLSMPQKSRVAFLLEDYDHLFSQPAVFERLIEGMRHRHSKEMTNQWSEALTAKEWPQLAEILLQEHYDPAYSQSAGRHNRPYNWELSLADGQQKSLSDAATTILDDTQWQIGQKATDA